MRCFFYSIKVTRYNDWFVGDYGNIILSIFLYSKNYYYLCNMKKCVRNIFVLVMACFILFGMGGLNIYHYCCDACEEYGHNIFTTISCEEVHSLHHCSEHHYTDAHCCDKEHTKSFVGENKSDICTHLTSHAKHCDVHHVDVFTELYSHSQDFHIDAPIALFVMYIIDNNSDIQFSSISKSLYNYSDSPPVFDGRAIIVRKNSYLI